MQMRKVNQEHRVRETFDARPLTFYKLQTIIFHSPQIEFVVQLKNGSKPIQHYMDKFGQGMLFSDSDVALIDFAYQKIVINKAASLTSPSQDQSSEISDDLGWPETRPHFIGALVHG